MDELSSAFNLLKTKLKGYEERPEQLEMADKVYDCLNEKGSLLVEAGTGVGKSFAYLIPAILSNEKTIVSTATITLQDQLVRKDILSLQSILPKKFSFSILKGKNNYLCLKRMREFTLHDQSYQRFTKWAGTTSTGDKDELYFIPKFWSRICGDSDDCASALCPFYNDCFYYRHYRGLYKKDILIVNHHLLIYDLLSDFSLLPFHEQLIIDEAHQIEDVISHVLGSTLSLSRIMWLLYRLRGLRFAVDHLFGPVESFFRGLNLSSQSAQPVSEAIVEELRGLKGLLALDRVIEMLRSNNDLLSEDEKDRVETTISSVMSLLRDIDDFIRQDDREEAYYLTVSGNIVELKSSLVEVQGPFNNLLGGYSSTVMTSATLTAGGSFSFLKERLGITELPDGAGFKEKVIGSPFDYRRQALLYIDKRLPPPKKENNETFRQEGLEVIEGLINASRGRALVLFTSHSHLNFVAENIRIDYPFKAQGDMPPSRLIGWFKKTANSVLLATATFWQGIDIKGEKLSLVIIVKMPFGYPGDPVYDERCRRLGKRWFGDLALPAAILLLRQGFGRLIRAKDDYGVVAILDSRVTTSSYGGLILSSLPKMDIVHDTDDVKRFFDSVPESARYKEGQSFSVMEGSEAVSHVQSYQHAEGGNVSDVDALGNLNDPSVIPSLIDFTRSANRNERRLTASALGKLAKQNPNIYNAVGALEALLEDEKPQVRHYALKALFKIGRVNREKVKSIMDNPYEKEYNIAIARRLMERIR